MDLFRMGKRVHQGCIFSPCLFNLYAEFSSVHFSHSVMSDSLRPHESQHARPPCPPPTPGVYSNSCPSSRWCHPAISSFVVPFSSCPESLPASGCFPMSQLFAYAEYIMQNARLDEAQVGIKISGGNIMAESEEELKSLLMKVKENSEKSLLKAQYSKN